jgi:hypothetical protein
MRTRGWIVKRMLSGSWMYLSRWGAFATTWDSDPCFAKRFTRHLDANAAAAVHGGLVTKAMRRLKEGV